MAGHLLSADRSYHTGVAEEESHAIAGTATTVRRHRPQYAPARPRELFIAAATGQGFSFSSPPSHHRCRGRLNTDSGVLDDDDIIASVQRAHREACEASRRATSSLGLDDMIHGNWRDPLPLRWVYFHVLRELAQHCGQADILREQILSE